MKLKKKVYETRLEKQKDFAIGVGVFIGLNVLLILLSGGASWLITEVTKNSTAGVASSLPMVLNCLFYPLAFLINILVPIYFILTRTWIGIGMLGTFAALLLLSMLLGVILSVICFAVLSSTS